MAWAARSRTFFRWLRGRSGNDARRSESSGAGQFLLYGSHASLRSPALPFPNRLPRCRFRYPSEVSCMRVTVKGKNVHVTDTLKAYAEKKLQKLNKYFSNIKDAQVTQSIQRNWHIVEVQLEGDGVFLRGEERSADMYASIDAVVEKLERQVKRFKGKLMQHPRPVDEEVEAETELEEGAEMREEEAEEGG